MNCPACREVRLRPGRVKHREVEIDYCPQCKGIWLDTGEINRVMEAAHEKLKIPRKAEPSLRTCPQCQVSLLEFNYPDTLVPVDGCRQCGGLWLDAGELKEMEHVRRILSQREQLTDHEPTGIKAMLLDFVNGNLEDLLKF